MRAHAALCLFALAVIGACGGKTGLFLETSTTGGAGSGVGGAASVAGSGGRSGSSAGAGYAAIDPCLGNSCNTPPATECVNGTELTAYDKIGTCTEGTCTYTRNSIACACAGRSCTTDPCSAVKCTLPPKPMCLDANALTTYASSGTCSAGSCSYESKSEPCPFGCANGACTPDPCASLTCQSPSPATCKNDSTLTTHAPSGTCSAGTCSYQATDSACGSNQLCDAAAPACTVCKSNANCGAACTACTGSAPVCKDLGSTSTCVGCLTNADCGSATPICDTTKNTCVVPKSCEGLAATCGPSGTANCCESNTVSGGTFLRSNLAAFPATVSDFRLDNYEVTVGRFRKFVAAYSQSMIAQGAGKNSSNPSDPGWDTAWNESLPADAATLQTQLRCDAVTFSTWTSSAGSAVAESRPINCVSWFVAQAFCTWDGARLPTNAESNYAAAGGSEQREYPWGSTPPDCSYANLNGCAPAPGVNRVGSESPKGDGRYGQSGLAGNAWEWAQDWFPYFAEPMPVPCIDCADFRAASARVIRGGAFNLYAPSLRTSVRDGSTPSSRSRYIGVRCARSAK